MLYVSGNDKKILKKLSEFEITDNMDIADEVLILPGGLGMYYDLFCAIKYNKKTYLYNRDFFYTPVIKNLYDLHLSGEIDTPPSDYLEIESELDRIIEKIGRD